MWNIVFLIVRRTAQANLAWSSIRGYNKLVYDPMSVGDGTTTAGEENGEFCVTV